LDEARLGGEDAGQDTNNKKSLRNDTVQRNSTSAMDVASGGPCKGDCNSNIRLAGGTVEERGGGENCHVGKRAGRGRLSRAMG
jgi:hypothetical protein